MVFEHYRELIPDFALFQERLEAPLFTHLRINTLKANPTSVLHAIREKGHSLEKSVRTCQTLYHAPALASPGNLLEYFLGHIHPQALTSCLASLVLSPTTGSYVLDLCAAPGGKTSHMAALMSNTGTIVANEPYSSRQVALGHTMDRLGVTNALVTAYPAQQFPMKHRFDFILADVPCSGEGTFRRNAGSGGHMAFPRLQKLQNLQKEIILRGFDLLSDKGVMLYATCTYNPAENEGVVDFLLQRRDAVLHAVEAGIHHEPGVTEWEDESYNRQLARAARFYPHRVDSVGFFMAKISKSS